jgi:hypothetical protein
MRPATETLYAYAAFCPSCGRKMAFEPTYHDPRMEAAQATCPCGKRWSMVFDIDPSGTFGVVSFQCDNGDRDPP